MMFKHIHLAAVFLVLAFPVAAQQVTFNLSIGAGTYAMKEFKSFQQDMKQELPFRPTVTDEFPPYLFYEASCRVNWRHSFFLGVSFAYGSTGGRVQYRDYSGYMRADQKLRYVNFGIPVGFRFRIGENLTLSADLHPTYTLTRADLEFEQEVMGEQETETLQFHSKSLALQPGVIVVRKIGRFGVHAQASWYQSIINDKLYYKEIDNAYLVNNREESVHPTWDGVRLSFGLSYFIR